MDTGAGDFDTLISLHVEEEMLVSAVESRIMVARERLRAARRKERQRRLVVERQLWTRHHCPEAVRGISK